MPNSTEFADTPLVPVTGTLYSDKSDPRFELALTTAEGWGDAGLPSGVVDGSENKWVAAAHRKRGATVLRSTVGGIASQRQQGARYASEQGATNVLTLEPEKPGVAAFAGTIIDTLDDVDILAIGRTEVAENSLPVVQQRTEHLAGWILEQTLNLPADSLAGPRGFSANGIKHLIDYPSSEPGMNNWIYMYQTMIEARHAGHVIDGIQIDMIHPRSMVEQETGSEIFDKKRYDQFVLQLDYLLDHYNDQIDPAAGDIAAKVLRMTKAVKEDPAGNFVTKLSRLEDSLRENGYEIAPRSLELKKP